MTQKDSQPDENFSITLSDLVRICNRGKKKVFWSAIGVGILGLVFSLAKPVQYKAEATFRDKGTKQSSLGGSDLAELFTAGLSQQSSEATATITSRHLMKDVIEKLGLQADISENSDTDSYLSRITLHLKSEFASFNHPLHPSLKDPSCCIAVSDIAYQGEVPLSFKVQFLPEGNYQVFDSNNKLLSIGELNQPFIQSSFRFTLSKNSLGSISSKPYRITLWPIDFRANSLLKKLVVKTEKSDKSLLSLTYQDRNRHLASKMINTLMESYQSFLQTFHDQQSTLQLAYLEQRQEETGSHLKQLMHTHAKSLSKDLSNVGFADSVKEMEFLAENQHQFKERMLSNELEMKRLNGVLTGKCVYYDQYARTGDSSVINDVLEKIRSLKQQRDSLQLSLSQSSFLDAHSIQSTFNDQLKDLAEVQKDSGELDRIIYAYKNEIEPDFTSSLFTDPRYLLKTWHDNLYAKNYSGNDLSSTKDWNKRKSQFLFYLENMKRLLDVHEKIIQERLTHQQNPSLEFQGVSLETANELYINYSKKLNEIHAEMQQNTFLANQIEEPGFEISSLSSSLKDPVSQELITRASQLLLNLKDANNRSAKEQDRLKDELSLQRTLLQLHLNQMTALLQLNQKLTEEKIYDLQNITLELIHQKISLLENNLNAYITSRLENIKQERSTLQQHLEEIQQEMATLPERWVREKLIDQNVKTNQMIVQEIAKMVEFKNISHKLELIQSAPIDDSIPSIHPISTRPVLYMFLGAFLGSLSSVGYILGSTLKKGIPASKSNLQLLGQNVAGFLSPDYEPNSQSPLRDQDLDTLRRLQGFFSEKTGTSAKVDKQAALGRKLLLIEGYNPDYSSDLSALFCKKGLKTVRLQISFNHPARPQSKPGLLQYLSGEVDFPTVTSHQNGDYIEAGGVTRFSPELLCSNRFQELLDKLSVKYDWIIAASEAQPYSSEAENLLSLFQNVAVTISNETLPELNLYTSAAPSTHKNLIFVLTAKDDA